MCLSCHSFITIPQVLSVCARVCLSTLCLCAYVRLCAVIYSARVFCVRFCTRLFVLGMYVCLCAQELDLCGFRSFGLSWFDVISVMPV